MAKAIDNQLYRCVEWHLHNRRAHYQTIHSERQEILTGSHNLIDLGVPSGHSKHSDPTSIKGILLVDGTKAMKEAYGWIDVIDNTRRYFYNQPEDKLFTLFYGACSNVCLVAAAMNISRQHLGILRNNVVYRCAILAAQKGLIRIEDNPKG